MTSTFGTIRVLVADDDVATRIGLQTIVDAEADMKLVGESSNGEEACRLARDLEPDVVLMDVRMPGTDGITATRRITALQGEKRPRVIVVTTYEIDDYVYRSLAAGASGFLLKRATPEEILDAIRTVARDESLFAPNELRRLMEEFAAERGEPTADALTELTKRELDVLALVAHGLSNGEIGDRLFVSIETVKTHVKHIYRKTGARDRAQLVIAAYESGLVERPER
jgi:DNA-binding NarL/FixJ family response regulator